jgi:hypothetical protein
MSEERMRTARKLIRQGRYDAARDILEKLDDPAAQDLLQQLTDRKAEGGGGLNLSTPMLLIIGSVALLVVVIVVALSGVLDEEDQVDTRYAEWDKLYIELINYCTPILGDGAEGCLDWADYLLGNTFADEYGPYYTVVQECLGPDTTSLETPEVAASFGECLQAAEVPEPGDQPAPEAEG